MVSRRPLQANEKAELQQRLDSLSRSLAIQITTAFSSLPFILIALLVFFKLSTALTMVIIVIVMIGNVSAIRATWRQKQRVQADRDGGEVCRRRIHVGRFEAARYGVYLIDQDTRYFVADTLWESADLKTGNAVDVEYLPVSRRVVMLMKTT